MNPALSKRFIYFVPPLLFSIVAAAFLWGLDPERDPREIPSVLIDDPVPDFSLPPIEGTRVPGPLVRATGIIALAHRTLSNRATP